MAISMLAQKLNMQPDEAERWIVNLIRNVRLDAKIDAQKVSPPKSATPLVLYGHASSGHSLEVQCAEDVYIFCSLVARATLS